MAFHSLDLVGVALLVCGPDGQISLMNRKARELFRLSAEEGPGTIDRFLPDIARVLANALPLGGARVDRARRADGTECDLRLQIARDEVNDAYMLTLLPLSEDDNTKRELYETASRLRAILDTAVDGIVIADRQGRILLANNACQTLLGWSEEELLQQNVKILMPEEHAQRHDGYIGSYQRTGVAGIIGKGRRVQARRRDGTTFPIDLSIGETEYFGQPIYVGLIHDVTEQVEAEHKLAQSQKMEIVGQLAGGIAHDFNNLLQVIMGNAELMAQGLETEEKGGTSDVRLTEVTTEILAAARRGRDLNEKILAFSRKKESLPSVVELDPLVAGMERLLRRALPADIDLIFALSSARMCVRVDVALLESSILNLVVNSSHAMPNGGTIRLTTRVTASGPEGEHMLRICVEDTGTGIAPENLARVCEPFFTTKKIGEGSGLGLSMVHGFIAQAKGLFHIDSTLGVGTRIELHLPIAEQPAPAAPVERLQAQPVAARPSGGHILFVEDDPHVSKLTQKFLSSLGYTLTYAANGDEALVCLEEGLEPDLLITDIMMPGSLLGTELGRLARSRQASLPIIFTSGYAFEQFSGRNITGDGILNLPKPYRLQDLKEIVAEALLTAPLLERIAAHR